MVGRGTPVRPDAVQPPSRQRHWPASLSGHVGLLIVGVLAIGVVAWILAGVVFALLHVIELIIVGALAGWAGYRLGRYRGRHERR
jgi:hypothetical protein